MRRVCIIVLLALPLILCNPRQSFGAAPPAAPAAASSQASAQAEKSKPEDVLRRMADYLANLPAFACKVEATLEINDAGGDTKQVTKMTARLQRPNRLALILDEGDTGITVVSDGKRLTQYMPMLRRYTIGDVPSSFAEMTDIGIPLKINILGSSGALIPAGGDAYYKTLMSDISASQYVGAEKVDGVLSHRLRFLQKDFDWDIWIEDGKRPVVQRVAIDLSKQFTAEKAKVIYTIAFSNWNISPKFKDADFAFTPPADATQVDLLVLPNPPHPLVGKPAPAFTTVALDKQPFDLRQHLGKDIIMLEFWNSSCGICVAAMPELDAIGKKFANRGVIFRAVNEGEDAATIKQFLQETSLKAPIVLDPEAEL
jgi:hypothetical protein